MPQSRHLKSQVYSLGALPFCVGDKDKKTGGAAEGGPPPARSGRVPTGGWVERGRPGEESVTGPVISIGKKPTQNGRGL